MLVGAACAAATPAVAAPAAPRHVFLIVLENKNAAETFGASSPAPYLAHALPAQGVYVPNYYGIGHVSLDNYVAMVSGQAPNPQTQSDCQIYSEFLPGTMGADGQALGQGCVYPAAVTTIANQLTGAGLTWKGYMEDMGADPARDNGIACAHPALNSPDPTQSQSVSDQYATRHNPFVYFHSIIDDVRYCAARDVSLNELDGDLRDPARTPNLAFITPDLCHDAHDPTCKDGGAGGLAAADAFLKTWVPKITGSAAYQQDGILIVTFDESENDGSACCDEPAGPNTPSPGGDSPGPGGGKVGAVILSPFTSPGTVTSQAYNHYGLLRSVEDLFGLPHLGYAGQAGLRPFGADVYSRIPATAPALPTPATAPATGGHCRSTRIAHRPRRLPVVMMLARLRVVHTSRGRALLLFTARHGARVRVRIPGQRTLSRRVRACRAYRIALPVRRGHATVTASTAHHVARRRLRL